MYWYWIFVVNLFSFFFFSKSKIIKNELEEEVDVKNDIVDLSTSKETPNVKRKSTVKNNSKKNSSLKKKKLSQNWNISDDI